LNLSQQGAGTVGAMFQCFLALPGLYVMISALSLILNWLKISVLKPKNGFLPPRHKDTKQLIFRVKIDTFTCAKFLFEEN